MTIPSRAQTIEMIPVDAIHVLNPRARNRRQHREIVDNISTIGLKRPITVSRRETADAVRYDLVCGEGRLEAFRMLGETEIPAIVIDAAEADCLVMSLVENIARRQQRPIDLMADIGNLAKRGYNDAEIAEKIGCSRSCPKMNGSSLTHIWCREHSSGERAGPKRGFCMSPTGRSSVAGCAPRPAGLAILTSQRNSMR